MDFMWGDWGQFLDIEREKPYFRDLQTFVESERQRYEVYPAPDQVFSALRYTSLSDTKIVILGQDPYHGPGQAHGLAFSVPPGVAIPPSLRNIFTELNDDLGVPVPTSGTLTPWAEQGVLLLNTTLTVRAHHPASHHGKGWEAFTDRIISTVNEKRERCVFVLWGNAARKKKSLVTGKQHVVLESAHPSPLSARHGFFGSKPFSHSNDALCEVGRGEIDWVLK